MSNQKQQNRNGFKLNLFKLRKKVWILSSTLCLVSLIGLFSSTLNLNIRTPLKLGLEYTGGSQITFERQCSSECTPLNSSYVLSSLLSISEADLSDRSLPNLSGSKVQILDNSRSLLVRLPFLKANQFDLVIDKITTDFGPFIPSKVSIETIGPTLGVSLLRTSLISLLAAFTGIAIYINIRYDRRFSILALLALAHDELIVCGVFAWLGILYNIEVDSLFAVALLTIAGYSVNNTVVVFDRIRERSRLDSNLDLPNQIDNAVTATFTRTIYTSATTLFPLICILIWGGSSLYWFAVALSLGVIIGSWSSIALAPSMLNLFRYQSQYNK